jgi:hypothetical protein
MKPTLDGAPTSWTRFRGKKSRLYLRGHEQAACPGLFRPSAGSLSYQKPHFYRSTQIDPDHTPHLSFLSADAVFRGLSIEELAEAQLAVSTVHRDFALAESMVISGYSDREI